MHVYHDDDSFCSFLNTPSKNVQGVQSVYTNANAVARCFLSFQNFFIP